MMPKERNLRDRQILGWTPCNGAPVDYRATAREKLRGVKPAVRQGGRLLRVVPILLVVSFFLCAGVVGAAEVTLTPQLSVRGSYDDNILLTENDKVSSSIITVMPSFDLDYKTLLSSLRLQADWHFLRYLDESDLNRTNQFYRLDGDHRLTERWTTSANAGFIRDTTLNTYLQETGRVFERVERDYFEAGAGLAYDMTQVSSISVDYIFQTANYDRDSHIDYDNHNARLYYGHRLKNERDSFSIGPAYYHRTNDLHDVDSFSLDLGWTRRWTSITRSVASIGVRHTNVQLNRDNTEYDSVGIKAGLVITSQGLASTTTFRYFHDLRTTAEGEDVNVDNLSLDYRRRITERFGIGINARLVFSYRLASEQSNLNDARYYWVEPYLSYRLTRNLDMAMRYSYQNHVEFIDEGDDRTRDRNIVWLQLTYAFPITL